MTANQLRARLLERNTNMRQFGIAHNYEPRTVQQTVKRHLGKDKRPQLRGLLTFRILADLSNVIGEPVIADMPELLTTTQKAETQL